MYFKNKLVNIKVEKTEVLENGGSCVYYCVYRRIVDKFSFTDHEEIFRVSARPESLGRLLQYIANNDNNGTVLFSTTFTGNIKTIIVNYFKNKIIVVDIDFV